MQNRGGGPAFNQNFRPQGQMGHPQQFYQSRPPPQRFQGQSSQPWPEMGSFGMPRGCMNRPRMNNQGNGQFSGPPPNNFNNAQNMRPNMRPSGPMSGPRFGQSGPPCRPPPHQHQQGPQSGPPRFFRNPGQGFQQRPGFQRPPGQHQQKQEKKMKVDKRELPENNKYYCEVCDRGYKDEDKYQIHVNTHEKCPKEGCSYFAAGKLVQLHIKMQHNSGLAKKIWSLESAEDIKKWREERKRNFPTAENIAKKEALHAERVARGEVIEEKYFGKMRGQGKRGRGRGRDRGRGRGRDQGNDLKRKADGDDDDACSSNKKLQVDGDGGEGETVKERMSSLGVFFQTPKSDGESSEESSSDDDEEDNKTSVKDKSTTGVGSSAEVTAAGALGSLIATYDISDDDEAEENAGPQELTSKDGKPTPQKGLSERTTPGKTSVTDGGGSGKQDPSKKGRQRNRGGKKGKDMYKLPTVDKTLLEKLLAKEIRQERNRIMQCVHYIVANNFFDKTTTTASAPRPAVTDKPIGCGTENMSSENSPSTANRSSSNVDTEKIIGSASQNMSKNDDAITDKAIGCVSMANMINNDGEDTATGSEELVTDVAAGDTLKSTTMETNTSIAT